MSLTGERRGRRVVPLLLAAAVVVALGAVCAVRMYRVHEAGWEWRLVPSAAPPKVHFAGRDYERGLSAAIPPSYARQGTTPGGGIVYALPGGAGRVHVVIYVRDGDTSFGYGLLGGP